MAVPDAGSISVNRTVDCGGSTGSGTDNKVPIPNDISIQIQSAGDFANDIMNQALQIAQENSDQAFDLAGDINAYVPHIHGITFPDDISEPIDFNTSMDFLDYLKQRLEDEPDLIDVSLDTASLGTLDQIPDLTLPNIPDFTKAAPVLNYPVSPIFVIPDVPTSPEVIFPTVPDFPIYIDPTEPTLSDIVIPSAPVIDVGEFTATLDAEIIPQLTDEFDWNEEDYESELKDAMVAVIIRDIQNGGYGIEATDEALIWQRSRDREQLVLNQRLEEATREWSLGGFTMPPGAMMNAVEAANQEFLNKVASNNREQTIEHSNKYWEGKKYTIDQAREVEQMLIGFHNSVQERALNAAKTQVEVGIQIVNSHIARFNAHHDRYKIEADVYEAQIRAEIAKVEIYKAQVDAVNAIVGYNRSLVEMYNAQLDATKNLVDRYRVQVEAYGITAGVEKTKVEIFSEQVNAFAAIIGGKEAEFRAYEASINGERAKAQAFEAEANAYRATVEGKKANIDAQKANVDAHVAKNQNVIDVFKAESDSLDSVRQAQLGVNQNYTQIYQARVQRFAAEADAAVKAFDLSSEIEENEYRLQNTVLQTNIENAKNQLYRILEISKIRTESLRGAADVHRSLAAAALSAINCNASLSEGKSLSVSQSASYGQSYSQSVGYQESKSCNLGYSEAVNWGFSEGYSTQASNADNLNHGTTTSHLRSWNDPAGRLYTYQTSVSTSQSAN